MEHVVPKWIPHLHAVAGVHLLPLDATQAGAKCAVNSSAKIGEQEGKC